MGTKLSGKEGRNSFLFTSIRRVRTDRRSSVRYVITKFSRIDILQNLVTHGAPLHALRARECSDVKLIGGPEKSR